MEQINFGKTKEGQEVMNYFITNSKGMKVGVTDYGATVTSILITDYRMAVTGTEMEKQEAAD